MRDGDRDLGDALNNLILTAARAARLDKVADWLVMVIDGEATHPDAALGSGDTDADAGEAGT